MDLMTLAFPVAGVLFLLTFLYIALNLRRVVSTNQVHIVQSSKSTTSYGKDTGNGNTYYEWPSWIPVIGVTKIVMEVSNFEIELEDYEAYDEGRLPFVIDVTAFFRVSDANTAAQRASSFPELKNQLSKIVQGSVRKILATSSIEEIMAGRSKFGDEFTKEVDAQLTNWGVTSVKSIELMDIRDHSGSNVIQNIMSKKKSEIEMESRTTVAKNMRAAQIAEIEAKREVELQAQQAQQAVGLRKAQTHREVSLAEQEAIQALKEQEKTTKEKEMSVIKIEQTRAAEIAREVANLQAQQAKETALINAEAQRQQSVIAAEAEKQKLVLTSEGQLEATRREAEGISLQGQAKAEAEKAILLAPVEAQIKLATEIGQNKEYQQYLVTIKEVEAKQAVGIEQAKALADADIKVIANAGSVSGGVNNVMDLFSSKGGTEIGAMLEALKQTEIGKGLLTKLVGEDEAKSSTK
jgi:flotillin